jgi:hypothetical protein
MSRKYTEVIRSLVKELADLNAEQRDAVRYPENIVVVVLVAKVGYLLDAIVSRHHGVAAIIYTRVSRITLPRSSLNQRTHPCRNTLRRIAILYRGRGPLLKELDAALSAGGHNYVPEADQRYSNRRTRRFYPRLHCPCPRRGPQPTT